MYLHIYSRWIPELLPLLVNKVFNVRMLNVLPKALSMVSSFFVVAFSCSYVAPEREHHKVAMFREFQSLDQFCRLIFKRIWDDVPVLAQYKI